MATAHAHPPAGRRTRWLAVVAYCPHCTRCHLHYAHRLADLLAAPRAGCGRRYRLHIETVRLDGEVAA